MRSLAAAFWNDEDGAVTVDWVVLTAAIVGLGIAIWSIIFPVTEQVAQSVDDALMANATVDTALDGQ